MIVIINCEVEKAIIDSYAVENPTFIETASKLLDNQSIVDKFLLNRRTVELIDAVKSVSWQ